MRITRNTVLVKYKKKIKQRPKQEDLTKNFWKLLPGPQTMAAESEADELFYGGQAGGGKSAMLLILSTTQHKRSIIFRRTYPRLKAMIEKSRQILAGAARYNSNDKMWRGIPGDRTLEFGSVEREDDKIAYQGVDHDLKCVGAGTLVWMSDGSRKPIEMVEVGDRVMTLDGSRRVTKLYRQTKPAILLKVFMDGRLVGQQVQSHSHELLVASGEWASHDMSFVVPAPSLPTPLRCAYKSAESCLPTFERFSSTPEVQSKDQAQRSALFQYLLDHLYLSDLFACKGEATQGSYFLWFGDQLQTFLQHLLLNRTPLRTLLAHLDRLETFSPPRQFWHEFFDAPPLSSQANSKDHCLSDFNRSGEQLHLSEGVVLLDPHQLDDVGQRIPNDSQSDVQDIAPKHSRHKWSYVHPYTKEIRQTDLALRVSSGYEVVPLSVTQLFDLTVEDSNHYITGGGFINRNCFDEITEFTQSMYTFIIGWNRSAIPGQRSRVICTGNPPTNAQGRWIVDYWAPWLKKNHPNPALPGELRWFISNEKGEQEEVPGSEPIEREGEVYQPRSRTFIPASLDDNPYLAKTNYRSVLQSMPEPLRSLLLKGRFDMDLRQDDPWQIIPTAWVKAAQERWQDRKLRYGYLGVDVSRGGTDLTVLAGRYQHWCDRLITYPGLDTPDGDIVAKRIVAAMTGLPVEMLEREDDWKIIGRYAKQAECAVHIDVVGVGSSPYDTLKRTGVTPLRGLSGGEKSVNRRGGLKTDRTGRLGFANCLSNWWWNLRELLDPTYGSKIELPPDDDLLMELTVRLWNVVTIGDPDRISDTNDQEARIMGLIKVESKDEVKKRIGGRSPDRADAVVYAFAEIEDKSHKAGWIKNA